ncbi:FAD linked oxidase N-terminal [Penicillium canescens]|uniref:FAD linked oxidase N-terminal n=1 Tax=Penicillium canescens TaxID=5083 RepID=A0AAD6I0M5_PENCN|nr:FAD linked oxidase N-terminal [Penicillium canescens]KAJ6023293.1 FAD linked oxidase N-terminal [Penicillium canescens]KAJ6025437.1 FAD linked oxidase N-terminal [Penicillium canescens]KAJ6042586.1 FAD linked oxidase N-terminal [Penicillium canescens]
MPASGRTGSPALLLLFMAAFVANETCEAFTPRSKPCTLGAMVRYTVNASSPDEFIETIRFAQERNIRFVIRNTGHEYILPGIDVLQDIDFLNYTSAHYTRPALRMTAGVQGVDIYEAAHARGLVIVGGECATVGPVGGYTQGGYPDPYRALSGGGGGGTYGVVYAMTVKAFPDFPATGVVLQFESNTSSSRHFFEAVGHYHRHLPAYTATGGMAIAEITHSSFLLTPLTLPMHTAAKAKTLLAPFLQNLHELNISYTLNITQSPSYFQHYMQLIERNPTQLVQNA